MHHPVHKSLKAAYSFYNVATVTSWFDLMQDALIVAKKVNIIMSFINRKSPTLKHFEFTKQKFCDFYRDIATILFILFVKICDTFKLKNNINMKAY